MGRFDGEGSFTREDFKSVLLAFEKQFGKPMPVSAQSETAVPSPQDGLNPGFFLLLFYPSSVKL